MDDARANDEPIEQSAPGTDRPASDLDDGEQSEDLPTGGDETTEEQLEADNPAEEETLKALDPDATSA
ncbi:hypothetical protein ACH3VR_13590 [Microbacterium sp. B2969]|uniref:Sugar ABC transporter ATPase n=1 Tax=Microbacterium alkaliflavum TaxID=3248839 RepID=A0ABW7Q9K2_9MICO